MLRALCCILFILCFFLLFLFLEDNQPQLLADIMIRVDVFGWTHVVRVEQERLDKINNLTIPYEDKQVLIKRTVFMGASPEMVELALGKPIKMAKTYQLADGKNVSQLYYVYYLPNDKRPTIFIFKDDVLVDAYKGSALDVR